MHRFLTQYITPLIQRYTKKNTDKKWAHLRAAELEKLDVTQYPWYAVLLDNQLEHIKICTDLAIEPPSVDIFTQFKLAASAARHLTTLQQIVGIQPMRGPTGLVYNIMRDSTNDSRLTIAQSTITAQTYSLSAIPTVECLIAPTEEDIELIGKAHAQEITRKILNDLINLGKQSPTILDNHQVSISDTAGVFSSLSFSIATASRRGYGSYIVCSSLDTASVIHSPSFVPITPSTVPSQILTLIGVMSTSQTDINVYVTDALESGTILMGFKGGSSELDVGYIYCPYVIQSNSRVVNNLAVPGIVFDTRYATWTTNNYIEDQLQKSDTRSEQFYRSIHITINNNLPVVTFNNKLDNIR